LGGGEEVSELVFSGGIVLIKRIEKKDQRVETSLSSLTLHRKKEKEAGGGGNMEHSGSQNCRSNPAELTL